MESTEHTGHADGPEKDGEIALPDPPSQPFSGRTGAISGPARQTTAVIDCDARAISLTPAAEAGPLDPAVEQLKQILLREAVRLRQNISGAMTVVVCVDESTELLVHFTQRDGGIDAGARCEPCDAPRLGALWPRLQEALAPRRIQLAPLRSSATDRSGLAAPASTESHPERRRNRNGGLTNRPGWETWM